MIQWFCHTYVYCVLNCQLKITIPRFTLLHFHFGLRWQLSWFLAISLLPPIARDFWTARACALYKDCTTKGLSFPCPLDLCYLKNTPTRSWSNISNNTNYLSSWDSKNLITPVEQCAIMETYHLQNSWTSYSCSPHILSPSAVWSASYSVQYF